MSSLKSYFQIGKGWTKEWLLSSTTIHHDLAHKLVVRMA
jgi:hypothetical protein